MDRRTFLGSLGSAAPAPAARPNVIWVLGDQHRGQALSCNGDPNVRTPNLDNLAAQGVNFTAAVSGYPLCCPFRGALLAGRYPHHCVPGHEYPLPPGQPTIAEPFRQAGYRTAYFGKWHMDGFKERDGRAAMRIIPPERRGRLPGYETDELTNLLIRYIRERAGGGEPFFAALSVQPPHDPYVAPEAFMRRHNGGRLRLRPNVPPIHAVQETARRDLAGYYAMIENLDWNVGRIRQALDETGLSFKTHILFFSDHGDMHGSHGLYRKTCPFEEAIRIPFLIGGEIARYNGRREGRFAAPLNQVDIAPTTLGLCGIRKRLGWKGRTTPTTASKRNVRPASPIPPSSSAFCGATMSTSRGGAWPPGMAGSTCVSKMRPGRCST